MNSNLEALELLEEHKSFHEKFHLGWIIKVIALSCIICIGLYALILQVIKGGSGKDAMVLTLSSGS